MNLHNSKYINTEQYSACSAEPAMAVKKDSQSYEVCDQASELFQNKIK